MSGTGTPTLLRVKRRITEDPADVLLLSAKRLKADSSGDEAPKFLKLAVTVEDQEGTELDETLARIINNKKGAPNFGELKERYKKSRQETGSTATRGVEKEKAREEDRFRLVNTKRAIKLDELEEWSENNSDVSPDSQPTPLYHLYDVVKDKYSLAASAAVDLEQDKLSCNGIEMIREFVNKPDPDQANYVYDVYYAEGNALEDFDDSLLDGLVSLQPFNSGTEFMYEEYRDNPIDFRYEDDIDSNDEDNEANEYPDEEDDDDEYARGYGFDPSDELGARMGRVRMCEAEADLSSDEEDKLLYTKSFEEDVNLHGREYAKYKQQMMKELNKNGLDFTEEDLLDDSEKDDSSDDNFDYF